MNAHQLAFPPVARLSDPVTSHVGAQEVTDSGARQSHMRTLLAYIEQHPGQPRAVIAAACRLSEYEASKRLSDLKNTGQVKTGEAIRVPSGRLQATWTAVSPTGGMGSIRSNVEPVPPVGGIAEK